MNSPKWEHPLFTSILYLFLTAISFLCQRLLLNAPELFPPSFTPIALTSIILLALVITGCAIIQYSAQRYFIFMLLILGFSGAAILESLAIFIPPTTDQAKWIFLNSHISDMWLVIVFALHLWVSHYQQHSTQEQKKISFLMSSIFISLSLTALFTILSYLLYPLFPLNLQTNAILTGITLITLTAYLIPRLNIKTPYHEWIIVFLVLTIMSQTAMYTSSNYAEMVSVLFKILSYFSILLGLLITIQETLKAINMQQKLLAQKNQQLEKAQIATEQILEKLRLKEDELQHTITDLKGNEHDMKILVKDLGQSKEKAEKEKAQDEAILANLGEGLIVTDKYGTITKLNESAVSLLNKPLTELLGKKWTDVIVCLDNQMNQFSSDTDPFMKSLSEGNKVATQDIFLQAGGKNIPISLIASPIKLVGFIIGGIAVFHDITEQKMIDQAKTEFVSLASHQLRTPLSTIKWYTELLLAGDAGELSEDQQNFLKEIYQGNERMIDLVNALLNVSRLELGTFAIEPEPVNISEIAESVLSEVKHDVETKKLQLEKYYDQQIPIIQADPKLFRIMIQNLVTNAIKYTPEEGHISMQIKLDSQILATESILISVADSGYGIPKEQQKHIFTKLFRADNVKIRDTQGTGLGLYIIKAIVDHSNGKIWFESEEDKGTTFYIAMPLDGMKPKQGSKSID